MTPSSPPFTPFQSCHVVKFDWPSDLKSSPWEINPSFIGLSFRRRSCLEQLLHWLSGTIWKLGKIIETLSYFSCALLLLNICYLSSKHIVYDIVVCIYCVASGCFLQRYDMWVCMNPLKHKKHVIYTSHNCFSRTYVFIAFFDCSGPSKTQTKKVACRCAAIENHHHMQQ